MKRLRLTILLLLLLPVLFVSWLTATETGLNWAYQKAEFYLPFELQINKLEGRLIGPLRIKGLGYQQDGTSINAELIIIDWLPTDMLTGSINVNRLQIKSLDIVLPESADAEATQTPATDKARTLPEINLPWRLLLSNTEISDINIRQNDQLVELNRITLNASTLFDKINIKQLSINADTFSLDIKGKLQPVRDYPHELNISWQLTLPTSEILTGEGQLAGDIQQIRLQQNLNGALQLTLDAKLTDLLDQPDWTATADIRKFDISRLNSNWPALSGAANLTAEGDLFTAILTGDMQGSYPDLGKLNADFDIQRLSDNTIRINHLQLQAPENDTELNADGLWMPGDVDSASNTGNGDSSNLKLALNWKNLRWPGHGTPWFNSANGSGTIEGNIDGYRVTLDTESPWPQTAPSTWHASGTGDLEGIEVQSLRIDALNGEANIKGQVNWSEKLNWQATGNINNIDPVSILPQWPGRLKGNLSSNGSMQDGKLLIQADIDKVTGKLRGHAVSLQGKLAWRHDHLDISQLDYSSGRSRVKLVGQVGETLNLDWTVNSVDLAELYPLAEGQLQATGKLTGPNATPLVKTSFKAKALAYPNYEASSIEGVVAVDLEHWQQMDIQLAAQGLKLNDTKLLSLTINTDDQSMTLHAVSSVATADIELKGHADTTGWHGSVEKFELQTKHYDNWQLDSPVPLSIDEKSLQLEKFCLHSSQQANACVAVKRDNALWLSSINLSNFPLKMFERWMPPDLKLDSVANAKAEVEFHSPETLLAQIDIELPAGVVSYPMLSGEKDQRKYNAGNIKLVLDSQGLSASSGLTMANGDRFTGRLMLPGLKPLLAMDTAQTLTAQAELQAIDLRLVETLFPEIYDLQGNLDVRLTARGTVDQPILNGKIHLANGSMKIPALGLDIEQLDFHSQSDSSRSVNYRLSAHSGDGRLDVSGRTRLDRDSGWPTEIRITGNDFEAAHIPEAKLAVSPDLKLNIKNRSIDIKGKVHIPQAKLQPKDITLAKNVSRDTVIIGSEQPAEEKWLIHAAVRLTLGERVHFYGYGFEGRLGGSLLLEEEPGQLTKATGEINIPEGTYRAYGQRLEVENGRILYTGSPLGNPGLDVRAVRKVDAVTAGIHVKGTLNQPQLEIFSNPAMGQTDALAYLLLGGPIENASNEDGSMMAKAALALGLSGGDTIARSLADRFGLDDMRVESSDQGDQAALVVGRYLSPEIYVSYGVGLIERINTLSLRYQIARKWQLKVESGEYHGADILYTIER